MASLHRHGPVLSKWPPAYLDRLVRSASSSLVPRRHRLRHSRPRTRPRLPAFSPPPHPHHLLLHCHPLANRSDRHRQLHLSQLSRPRPRHLSARRPFPRPLHPAILESATIPPSFSSA